MNNIHTLGRGIAIACALAAGSYSSDATAGRVGYYFNCDGAGRVAQEGPITTAGHTPVNVATPDAATLATLDALVVDMNYCGNAEYTANQTAISSAVNNGMTLIVHDRVVTGSNSLLPGGGTIVLSTSSNRVNIDFPAGSPIVNGPGGMLSNTSLDNGNSSNHGYAQAASLPAGAQILADDSNPANAVTFAYGYGAGRVVYSTIPFDYYLSGSGPAEVRANMVTRYMPNLIAWAAGPSFTTCAAEGFTGSKLTLCQKICEINQTPTTLSALIRMYRAAYRENPPCAD